MPTTYSPLRYPGGKSQLYKFVKKMIDENIGEDAIYIEPFAGGAGVAIQLLIQKDVKMIAINDLDKSIHSLWYSILNYPNEFINLIKETTVSIEEWQRQKEIYKKEADNPFSLKGGFATFFLNRTNVSGIISGGPIGGAKQAGNYKLDCRFNKKSLIKKITDIASLKDSIILTNMDAESFIEQISSDYPKEKTFIFFDPPYFTQGKNLYLKFIDKDKHQSLKECINKLENYKWIITYDNADEIYEIYKEFHQKYKYQLRYSANNKRKEKAWEYLFASSITKIDNFANVELLKLVDK
ncbi:DNA adenine methylase [Enterococcus casseliflavus]|uniref:DNA adenine methylase n=1 Tax=Enterococcus casseliflavus TaxID=37734 RepID=UPI0018ABDEB4|nr:DNA adenine methylase [Enterococcus casseliflavus]